MLTITVEGVRVPLADYESRILPAAHKVKAKAWDIVSDYTEITGNQANWLANQMETEFTKMMLKYHELAPHHV